MNKRLKVGVVGSGGIFEGWGDGSGHLPAYPWLIDEAQLVSICDLNEGNLKKAAAAVRKLFSAKAGIAKEKGAAETSDLLIADSEKLKLYTNLDEMLNKEHLDIIDIITPCGHHPEAIKKSLNANCHIMCEKPVARTWLEAEEIVKEVEKAKKVFQYNENLIFSDPYYDIRKLIRKGEIGELEAIWFPFAIGEPGNYSYTREGIGSLLDMGIHGITLCWFLFGFDYAPKRVKSLSPEGVSLRMKDRLINGAFKELTVEDDAHFAIEFENPVTGHWVNAYIEASWSDRDMQNFKIVGSKGEITIEGVDTIKVTDVFENSHIIKPFHPPFLNAVFPPGYSGFPQEIKAMVSAVKQGIKPLCDENIAAESLAIAQAVYLSEARGRKAVSLDEFKEYAKDFKENPEGLLQELLEKGIKR